MTSQVSLRPFDVAVALRLLLSPEERYEPLAHALATSTSAVHRAVVRLQLAGFCGRASRTIDGPSLQEFLLHGLRYAFPPIYGPKRRGLPTAAAHPLIAEMLGAEPGPLLVWPMDDGPCHAVSLTPMFAGMLRVAQQDRRMHELLATVDLLRVASAEQRAAASALLGRMLTID